MERVEQLLEGESLEAVRNLVAALLDTHRAALGDLMSALDANALGEAGTRPSVTWLLALHEMNPEPLAERARKALREGAAAIPQGVEVDIVDVIGERVRIHVARASRESAPLIRRSVERAILQRAPEAVLEFDGLSEPSWTPLDVVPAAQLLRKRSPT